MFDYSKLCGRIREVYKTQQAFAEALGIHYSNLNLRLNNKVEWKSEEIYKACKLLNISPEETHLYFFSTKSGVLETFE